MENLNRNQKIILITIVCFMLLVIGYYIMQRTRNNDSLILDFTSETVIAENSYEETRNNNREEVPSMVVHIMGEVREAGVIELKEGDRVADAIEKGGGITPNADLTHVNLAHVLSDGQRIYIPSILNNVGYNESASPIIVSEGINENIVMGSGNDSSRININRATQTELETLTGVGPSTALRIIEHRRTNGDFKSIEDIKSVSGIGEARFEAIRNHITI